MTSRPTSPRLVLLSLLLLTVVLAGCSEQATTPVGTNAGADDYAKIDFSLPYGGLTATGEAEAFGDEAMLALSLAEEGEEVMDPMADHPMVREMEHEGDRAFDPRDPARPHFTFVHLRWGMLRDLMDSVTVTPPCEVTDWAGAINVDRGLLVVRRVIRFERPLDHVIFPRLDLQTVGLVSHTACGFDGIVLQILERPAQYAGADSTDLAPNMLHIRLGDFSADIAVRDLAGLERVVEVGDQGNQFAVNGFTLSDLSVCPKGFLSGHWRVRAERPDSLQVSAHAGERYGVFAGNWRALEGRTAGHLRGAYGVDENGQRVFVGKYIGRRGEFRGLIRGTWEPGLEADQLATFHGNWASASGQVEGVLGGEAFPVEGTDGGFFVGRWTTACDDQAEELVR